MYNLLVWGFRSTSRLWAQVVFTKTHKSRGITAPLVLDKTSRNYSSMHALPLPKILRKVNQITCNNSPCLKTEMPDVVAPFKNAACSFSDTWVAAIKSRMSLYCWARGVACEVWEDRDCERDASTTREHTEESSTNVHTRVQQANERKWTSCETPENKTHQQRKNTVKKHQH